MRDLSIPVDLARMCRDELLSLKKQVREWLGQRTYLPSLTAEALVKDLLSILVNYR